MAKGLLENWKIIVVVLFFMVLGVSMVGYFWVGLRRQKSKLNLAEENLGMAIRMVESSQDPGNCKM